MENHYYWLIAGVILILKDSFILNTVFILIFGISALIISVLIAFNIIAANNYFIQLVVFTILICILLMVMFIRRKTYVKQNYNNIIGNKAIVYENTLTCDKIGNVKWSGTIARAKISDKSNKKKFEINEVVEVDSVTGNILYIKEIN